MESCVSNYLKQIGYDVNTDALDIIKQCNNWYSNNEIDGFHKRENLNGATIELKRLNFAKRCCSDDANLCEIISVVPEKNSSACDFINNLLETNRFDTMYRRQLESTSALGTTGAYIYLENAKYLKDSKGVITVKGGVIKINYVNADCIVPLTIKNGEVIECAFHGTSMIENTKVITLVVFRIKDKKYSASTVMFNKEGEIIEENTIQLGEVKPFAIMQTAEVNNRPDMTGYGLPKIYGSIPMFMIIDLCFNLLFGDLSKADKLVFLNELLACIKTDKDGKPRLTKQQKEVFILLGEDGGGKLPEEKSLVYEYNPKIRIEEITKAFELALSLLSLSFGYGTKKYTFENGRITTATECIITNQQQMQELNRQRKQSIQYITDIIHAALWFSNSFNNTNYNVNEPLNVEFDDSVITDKETELERLRNDAQSFEIPQLRVMYLMAAYHIPENKALKWVEGELEKTETDDDELD